MLSAELKKDLRSSWKAMEPDRGLFIDAMYEEFFAAEPHLRILFEIEMDEQHAKLMQFVGNAMDLLDEPERLGRVLRELGARHAGYGVGSHLFEPLGEAWMAALDRVLGERFTPAASTAWKAFYDQLVDGMLLGMGAPHVPAPVD